MARRIPIKDATDAELTQFATETLGMVLAPGTIRATVLAKVQAAWDKPHIVLDAGKDEEEIRVGAEPQPVTPEQEGPRRGYVRLQLHPTEEAGGTDAVPVGVNGKIMLIPRGEPVDVPYPYFEALSRAVMHKFDPLPDGGISDTPRLVALYPYQVMGGLKEAQADLAAQEAAAA